MKKFFVFLRQVAFIFGIIGNSVGELEDALHSFERLQHVDLVHKIIKRSTAENPGHTKEVQFDALGRHFRAHLWSSSEVLSPYFKAYSVGSNNEKSEINIDKDNLYQGYLTDDPENTHVKAHWEGNAILATIETPDENYYVEPAWRFLKKTDMNEMIVYRGSDMKEDAKNNSQAHLGKKYCSYIEVPDLDEHSANITEDELEEDHHRRKRQVALPLRSGKPTKDTCPLLLVADYRFHTNMGRGSMFRTASYLLGLADRVDAIYRRTDFGNGYKGMGFEVKELRIHQAPTSVGKKGGEHYNMNRTEWDTKRLLEMFSEDSSFRSFCLAHLFTYQAFEGGVLGLAYIGAPRTYSVGGICSPAYNNRNGGISYLNTGWSSTLNSYERRILTQEADLVTTHEFGHNWGSEHDPGNAECSPPADSGGKFIMYTYSVSGYDPNNKVFSPCSRRSIQAVLKVKSHKCFTKKGEAYCGNHRVEKDEECDGGLTMTGNKDPCCYKDCKLRGSAECSDRNHRCCKDCKIISKFDQEVCRVSTSLDASCWNTTYCGGEKDCPESQHAPNGTQCLERGKCFNGVCQPYCESNGKVSCICDDAEVSCKWCCRNNSGSACEPMKVDGTYIDHSNGKPCIQGYCDNGVCKKQVEELVQRIWSIIESITPDKVVAFMRANIVGTVIILSLILWIPGSCIVWCLDRRSQQHEDEMEEWHRIDNPYLHRDMTGSVKGRPEQSRLRSARMCDNVRIQRGGGRKTPL